MILKAEPMNRMATDVECLDPLPFVASLCLWGGNTLLVFLSGASYLR